MANTNRMMAQVHVIHRLKKTILHLFDAKKKTPGEMTSYSRNEKIFKSGKIFSHVLIVSLLINADTIQIHLDALREIYIYIYI